MGATSLQVDATNPVTVTITLFATNPTTVSFSAAGSTFSTFLPTSSTTISQINLQVAQLLSANSFSTASSPATSSVLLVPSNQTLVISNQIFSYTASFSTSFSTSTSTAGTPANAAGFEISQGATGTCRAEFDKEPATGTGAGPITTARGPRLDITFTVPR